MEIRKEVPQGAINGVNKSFTLLNTPSFIDDIFFDGAIYIDFVLNGNILTLSDAPIYSLQVDYTTGTEVIPTTTQITLGDIKTKIWTLLGQRATSINFSPDIVTDEINNNLEDIWRGKLVNKLSQKIIRAGKLWFQEGFINFKTSGVGVVSDPVIIGANTITASTTGLKASGYVLIGGDIVNYTSKTDTTLVGVSGITTSHDTGDKIFQLYDLPTDYDIMLKVEQISHSTNGIYYSEITRGGYISYEIIRNGTKVFTLINGISEGNSIKITYCKKFFDLVNDSDICPLPDRYGIKALAYICAGNLGYDKTLLNAERLLNQGYSKLEEMYGFFNNEVKEITKTIRPQSYKFNTMRVGRI